ncbi:hypothetical protein [Aliiglaciecola litoralis]|uniref:hypothetical protein n=1 Tax=Aliiglaciecola litoralis TaxID=582857 RepID=UPI0031DD195B
MRSCTLTYVIFALLLPNSHSVLAQGTKNISSLMRFEPLAKLGLSSDMEIRGAHVGDNVLEKVSKLAEKGGEVQYISGGNRSNKVNLEYAQPYLDSTLIQNLEIRFDKDHGFINEIDLTYTIASRYLDILPVYQKTIIQAVEKYGEPLSFEQVQQVVKNNSSKPTLTDFINNINTVPTLKSRVRAFFEYKKVTSKTHFIRDENNRALLLTGFKQCYFWTLKQYTEVLTLCSFQPSSGNMKGQGITLSLVDFAVSKTIEDYQVGEANIDIEL